MQNTRNEVCIQRVARHTVPAVCFVAWVSDITYIATREGWLYLAAVMDLYSGKIVGWAMSERMTQELVISALKQAVGRTRPPRGIILHSDRGIQYASKRYRNLAKSYGFSAKHEP